MKNNLPSFDEIYQRSIKYSDVECNLQNFNTEDEIAIERTRYCDGYIQAIKDYVDSEYNPS